MGITHVALGKIRRAGRQLTLIYQWYRLPGRQPLGLPLTGTADVVVAALPRLATRLARAVGIASPRVPARTDTTPDELRQLGGLPWITNQRSLTEAEVDTLYRLTQPILDNPDHPGRRPSTMAAFQILISSGSHGNYQGVSKMVGAWFISSYQNAS